MVKDSTKRIMIVVGVAFAFIYLLLGTIGIYRLGAAYEHGTSFELVVDDNSVRLVESFERINEQASNNQCLDACSYLSYHYELGVNCLGLCRELRKGDIDG